MNYLFLIDPIETLNLKKDTSLALMAAACERGHSVYWLTWRDLSLVSGNILFKTTKVAVKIENNYAVFKNGESSTLSANKADVIFIRTDPPFDLNYLTHTWLLEYVPQRTLVLNQPSGLRTVNEKIFAARYRDLIPETVITADKATFQEFLAEHKHIVAKPANGFGGSAVFLIREGDTNAVVIFETLTRNSEFAILQQYIPDATKGDKRILLLGGEVLGAVLRLHPKGDHRNNFAAGGSALATTVSERDQQIISAVRGDLLSLGLHFVGLDIIGGKLIEINVTSPTCLREINQLTNQRLELKVIEYAEQLAAQNRDTQTKQVPKEATKEVTT